MTYLTVHYKNTQTLEVEEKIFRYRYRWMAIAHTIWLDMYNDETDPSLTTRVEYNLN